MVHYLAAATRRIFRLPLTPDSLIEDEMGLTMQGAGKIETLRDDKTFELLQIVFRALPRNLPELALCKL